MITPNTHYADLKDSYLFYNIAQKTKAYLAANPDKHLYRMGIGDVSLPLCDAVIRALHEAVDDQAKKENFHGYMPECGAPFLRETIAKYYADRGVTVSTDEVFVSSGASDELGDILDLFDRGSSALVIEPAYPAYVDANVMAGRKIVHLASGKDNGFLPSPSEEVKADILYICSPNNPTGAVFSRNQLQAWVDFANENGSVILFDAAYEAFIEDESLPHSIFELDGAETCAIEICSLSKTAGFTGTRLGYTVIPKKLIRHPSRTSRDIPADCRRSIRGSCRSLQTAQNPPYRKQDARDIRFRFPDGWSSRTYGIFRPFQPPSGRVRWTVHSLREA